MEYFSVSLLLFFIVIFLIRLNYTPKDPMEHVFLATLVAIYAVTWPIFLPITGMMVFVAFFYWLIGVLVKYIKSP